MVKTCAVPNCKTGYKAGPKGTSVFSFPTDDEERKRWIKSIPNQIDRNKNLSNIGICSKHWPASFPTVQPARWSAKLPHM